jgi:hypothetical protein
MAIHEVPIPIDYPESFTQPFRQSLLPERLNEIYHRIESDRKVAVPLVVRNFIEVAITETFYLGRLTHDVRQLETSFNTVAIVLSKAQAIHYEGTGYVGLVGVIEQLHSGWCSVPPFCRPAM